MGTAVFDNTEFNNINKNLRFQNHLLKWTAKEARLGKTSIYLLYLVDVVPAF